MIKAKRRNKAASLALLNLTLLLAAGTYCNACNQPCLNSIKTCSGKQLKWSCLKHQPPDDMATIVDGNLPYLIQSTPIFFTVQPKNATGYNPVDLSCSINTVPHSYQFNGYHPSIIWKRVVNGTVLYDTTGTVLYDTNGTTSSTFKNVGNGTYICMVDDGKYTVVSAPATVTIKEFDNTTFSYDIYNTLPTISKTQGGQEVSLFIPRGGAAILDCTTNEYKKIDWSIYHYYVTPNTQALIISSFNDSLLSSSLACTFFIHQGQQKEQTQKAQFFKLHYKHNVSSLPHFVVKPKSHDLPMRSNVTLYCLAESSTPLNYTWYRNGDISWYRNWDINWNRNKNVGIPPQVLVLENVTESANYTCQVWNGNGTIEWTAEINVYGTPVVNIDIDYIAPDALNISSHTIGMANSSLTLNLSCSVDSYYKPLQYKWYFRGMEITAESTNPVLHNESTSLTFLDMKTEDALGSVQCLVEGISGWGSDYIRIIVQDKPNPPGSVQIIPPDNAPYNYTYKVQWTPPQNEPIFYELRMNIHCSRDDWLSTFSPENCVLYSSKCDAYVYSTDYYCAKFYAASIGNRNYTSDYSLPSNSVSIHRKLPETIFLQCHETIELLDDKHSFKVSFQFKKLDQVVPQLNYSYVQSFYDDNCYCVEYKCEDQEKAVTLQKDSLPCTYNTLFTCCKNCQWRIKINDPVATSFTEWKYFSTPSIKPTIGFNLSDTDLQWIGSTGMSFSISSQLPPPHITCNLSYTTVDIYCPNGIHEQHNFSSSIYNFSKPLLVKFNNSLNVWEDCDVFYTYTNPSGTSPTDGQSAKLPSYPSKDNIKDLNVSFLSANATGSDEVQISWTIPESYHNLLQKYLQMLTIQVKPDPVGTTDCSYQWSKNTTLCNSPHTATTCTATVKVTKTMLVRLIFTVKTGPNNVTNVSTCRSVNVNVNRLSPSSTLRPLVTSTAVIIDVSVPSSPSYLSVNLFLEVMLSIVGFFVIIFVVALFFGCSYCLYKKRITTSDQRRRQNLGGPDGSDVDEAIQPLLLSDDRASLISEKTEYKELIMDKFLESISETSEGPKDEAVHIEVEIPVELEPTDEGKKTYAPQPKSKLTLPSLQVNNNLPTIPLSNFHPVSPVRSSAQLSSVPISLVSNDMGYYQLDDSESGNQTLEAAAALNKPPLTLNSLTPPSVKMEMNLFELTEEGQEVNTPTNSQDLLTPTNLTMLNIGHTRRTPLTTPLVTPTQPTHFLPGPFNNTMLDGYIPNSTAPTQLLLAAKTPNLAMPAVNLTTPINNLSHLGNFCASSLSTSRKTPPQSAHSSTLSLSSGEGTDKQSTAIKRLSSMKKMTKERSRRTKRSHSRSTRNSFSGGRVSSSSSTDSVFQSGTATPTSLVLNTSCPRDRRSSATSGISSAPSTPWYPEPNASNIHFEFPSTTIPKNESVMSRVGTNMAMATNPWATSSRGNTVPLHCTTAQGKQTPAGIGSSDTCSFVLNNTPTFSRPSQLQTKMPDGYLTESSLNLLSPPRLSPVHISPEPLDDYLSNDNFFPSCYNKPNLSNQSQLAPQRRHSNIEGTTAKEQFDFPYISSEQAIGLTKSSVLPAVQPLKKPSIINTTVTKMTSGSNGRQKMLETSCIGNTLLFNNTASGYVMTVPLQPHSSISTTSSHNFIPLQTAAVQNSSTSSSNTTATGYMSSVQDRSNYISVPLNSTSSSTALSTPPVVSLASTHNTTYSGIPSLYSYNRTAGSTSLSLSATSTTASSASSTVSLASSTASSRASNTVSSASTVSATGIVANTNIVASNDVPSAVSSRSNSITDSFSLASTSSSIENLRDNPELLDQYSTLSFLSDFDSFPSALDNDYV